MRPKAPPPKFWCLVNSRTGHMIKGLAFNEARAAVSGFSEESRTDWWVWNEGWPDWKPLIQVRLLIEPMHRTMKIEPPPFQIQSDKNNRRKGDVEVLQEDTPHKVFHLDETLEDLEISKVDFVNRVHRRIHRRFKVRIHQNGLEFVSYTVDISAGGMQLEDTLPEWVAGYCQVFIVKLETKKAIEVTCSVVENQKPTERTRLQILNLGSREMENALDNWLAA
ncbi:MAG: PilZ domain-containing protein [Bdellovibrionales bacterium]|nr:PilZ domain-containing protein [Bdellovibrionales bacterium]